MTEIASLDCDMVDRSKPQEVGGDPMVVDGSPANAFNQSMAKEANAKKSLKRKRDVGKDKESLIAECHRELDELFDYYKEISSHKLQMEEFGSSSINSAVACLIEESNLPFSKLVEEVYGKLKAREGNQDITLASIRSAVLFVGQRQMYGIDNADADVLEDESQSCLWCWETRDKKLLPTRQRGILKIRHIGRKKIHERISALSATLSTLSINESRENNTSDVKTSEKLGKPLSVTGIRSLLQKLKEKHDAEMADKETKIKEKDLTKESEKNKRNAEKEKKRMDRELQKERLQTEKDTKRLQDEVIKEEKRREKEEAELKKKLKRQQEEAERDRRQREKEEAELKRQLTVKKQATIMERFLKSRKSNNSSDNSEKATSTKAPLSDNSEKATSTKAPLSSSSCRVEIVSSTTLLMDHDLSRQDSLVEEDIRRWHVAGWHKSRRSNRSHRWGVRRNPKTEAIKELKLQRSSIEADPQGKFTVPERPAGNSNVNSTSDQSIDKLADGYEGSMTDATSCHDDAHVAPTCVQLLIKKLLQFDKSHRPAYYGTRRQRSRVVGPRHPFKKDPDLDYDVDSDEEWEEEDPGESLSDCDKEDAECLEEGNLKSDEDESEDGFFVPDGYLSENEGIPADSPEETIEDENKSSSPCKPETENEELRALLRQQKYLQNLTDQALRKSQPLIILNLMHEKSELVTAEDLISTAKLEQICLQALCMQACDGGSTIDVSIKRDITEDHEVHNIKESPTPTIAVFSESDLQKFVESIRENPQGMNKVVESLQRKFPAHSKSQLRNKVKEISNFVDNQWQVKKEVLVKLGLPLSPVMKGERQKSRGIAAFFSKRCLPPLVKSMNVPESSRPVEMEAIHAEDNCSKM